jgi:WD40 repeat protein
LWDVATGKEIRAFSLDRPESFLGGYQVSFRPDGKALASGGPLGTICLWEVPTGKLLATWGKEGVRLSSWAFSPNGQILAATGNEGGTTRAIYFRNLSSGKELPSLRPKAPQLFTDLTFSSDGKFLTALGGFGTKKAVRQWEWSTGKEVQYLVVEVDSLSGATLSPGASLLAAARGKDLKLWNLSTGQEVRRMSIAQADTYRLAFSPDGQLLAGQFQSEPIRLWDVNSGKELCQLSGKMRRAEWISISPDKRHLAASVGASIRIWELPSGKPLLEALEGHEDAVNAVAFSADGGKVISGGEDGTIRSWDTVSGQQLGRICPPDSTELALTAVSSVGRIAAAVLPTNGVVLLYDTTSAKELCRFTEHHGGVTAIALSASGDKLASAHKDGAVRLWDTATARQHGQLGNTFQKDVGTLAFSRDSRLLAAGCEGGGADSLTVWDLSSFRRLEQFRNNSEPVAAVTFSPDNRMLAASGILETPMGYSGHVKLWEITTGKERCRIGGARFVGSRVLSLAFSEDGRWLVFGASDQRAHVWDLVRGEERVQFEGHRGAVRAISMSFDSRRLITGSTDTTLLIWNLPDPLQELPNHSAAISTVELEKTWADLASEDAGQAYRAIGTLAGGPKSSVSFLAQHLKPVPSPDPQKLKALFLDLDHDQVAVRERASTQLSVFGESIVPFLHRELAANSSAEVRRRIGQLLDNLKHPPSAETLRQLRAVEALERIHTPEAVRILSILSGGAKGALLTRDACSAVERLKRSSLRTN